MGLYDQKIESLKLRKDKEYIIIGLIVFFIIIVIGYVVLSIDWKRIGEGNNHSVKFSKSPYSLSKDKNVSVLVNVKNNSDFDAKNSIVTIVPVEKSFFVTCNASEIGNNKVIIPIMSKGSSRTIVCSVKVSPTISQADILPGTYGFDVLYTLNNIEYEKRATLTIKE